MKFEPLAYISNTKDPRPLHFDGAFHVQCRVAWFSIIYDRRYRYGCAVYQSVRSFCSFVSQKPCLAWFIVIRDSPVRAKPNHIYFSLYTAILIYVAPWFGLSVLSRMFWVRRFDYFHVGICKSSPAVSPVTSCIHHGQSQGSFSNRSIVPFVPLSLSLSPFTGERRGDNWRAKARPLYVLCGHTRFRLRYYIHSRGLVFG